MRKKRPSPKRQAYGVRPTSVQCFEFVGVVEQFLAGSGAHGSVEGTEALISLDVFQKGIPISLETAERSTEVVLMESFSVS